jgi:hypothetical protein
MINFAGGCNLPIWMTEREGLFAAEKISVKIDFTPGSTYQLTHLIAGNYDMGFTAIDNIIAYREGQIEANLPPGTNVDLIAILASDDGLLSISAQKGHRLHRGAQRSHGDRRCHDHEGLPLCCVMSWQERGFESEVKFERAGGVPTVSNTTTFKRRYRRGIEPPTAAGRPHGRRPEDVRRVWTLAVTRPG